MMTTKKKIRSTKSTTSKKATKPRAIKVVDEVRSAGESQTPEAPKRRSPRPTKAATAEKRLSAIDAAAKVLAGSHEPLNAKQLIEAIVAQGLWSSPAGKTPHATLYSAILREIQAKGNEARFTKAERGKFAINQ
jgi:ribonuclease D